MVKLVLNNMYILKNKNKYGFTLIEILVALAIFTFVIVIGLSTLVVSNSSAKRSTAIRTAIDNVQYSMEVFTRTARLGYAYTCFDSNSTSVSMSTSDGFNCPTPPGGGVAFYVLDPTTTPSQTDRYAFYLENSTGNGRIIRCIEKDVFPGGLVPPTLPDMLLYPSGNCAPLTSDQINVSLFEIDVNGASITDNYQPSIKVKFGGEVNTNEGSTDIYLQTFISQRQYE